MTARQLQSMLEKEGFRMDGQSYEIEDRIGEYMREDWFKEYPLDNLIYHSEHLPKYLPSPPTFSYPSPSKLPFP